METGSVSFPKKMREHHWKYNVSPFLAPADYKVGFRYENSLSNDYSHHKGQSPSGPYRLGVGHNWVDNDCSIILQDPSLYSSTSRIEGNRPGLTNKNLVSGKHIRWFTNGEIGLKSTSTPNSPMDRGEFLEFKKPVPYTATETVLIDYAKPSGEYDNPEPVYSTEAVTIDERNTFRYQRPKNGIGGFNITAEDGTVYHYSLPVYNWSQYAKVTNKNSSDTPQPYSSQKTNSPYAVAWMLTAVTGPDFVDRGEIGILDEEDWGYWVKLDYGRFSSKYKWRTPYIGESYSDRDLKHTNYSEGTKETYYLNSISTRTHTALFIKDVREDGRGHYTLSTTLNPELNNLNEQYPSSSLKLDEIILLSNNDYKLLTTENGIGASVPAFGVNTGNNASTSNGSLRNNDSYAEVFDKNDIAANSSIRTFLNDRSVKRTVFNYTYELCPQTTNSFASAGSPPAMSESTMYSSRNGKLTLRSFSVYGPQSVKLMPDFLFEYGYNPAYHKDKWDAWGHYNRSGQYSLSSHRASTYDEDGAAWSLKKVTTPLGSTTEMFYERDSYSRVSDYGSSGVIFPRQQHGSTITVSDYTGDFRNSFKEGDYVNLVGQVYNEYACTTSSPPTDDYREFNDLFKITGVSSNSITIENPPPRPPALTYPEDCSPYTSTMQGTLYVPNNIKGGNIRVARVEVGDDNGNKYKTRYLYAKTEAAGSVSSGVVAKEPPFAQNRDYGFYYLFDYPSTPVLYGSVTVLNGKLTTDSDFDFKTQFKFYTPSASMVTIKSSDGQSVGPKLYPPLGGSNKAGLSMQNFTVEVNTGKVGQLESVRKINRNGIVENNTVYAYSNQVPNKLNRDQGLFTQGLTLAELLYNSGTGYAYKVNRTTKKYIPTVVESVTTTNSANVKSTTKNISYDFYSGEILKKEFSNSLGIKYQSVKVPAYAVESSPGVKAYPAMGAKADNSANKNMLIQPGSSYLYKVTGTNTLVPVAASNQTWKSNWKYRAYNASLFKYEDVAEGDPVWRKAKTYVWNTAFLNSDGTSPNPDNFNWAIDANQTVNWFRPSEVIRYDHYSKPLSVKDINNNSGSFKLGYNQTLVIASAANARYTEIAYSGAEDRTLMSGTDNYNFGGEIRDAKYQDNTYQHTGNYCIKLGPGQTGFTYKNVIVGANDIEPDRTYRASVWVHKNDYAAKGGRLYAQFSDGTTIKEVSLSDPSVQQAGDWYLLSMEFPITSADVNKSLVVGCRNRSTTTGYNVYFDDFRFHPVEAPLTTYVYDARTGQVTHVLDKDNLYTRYEYDAAGVLVRTYREVLGPTGSDKIVSEYKYNYARPR
jgi:hypothetical protein